MSHSSSRTGATDSRDWRINSIFASLGSALIASSVTGRASARTGSTATETQARPWGRAAGAARHAHDADHRGLGRPMR